jgi:hypothetical protein
MESAICLIADQSASGIRKNMATIKLLTVAGPPLCHAAQADRVVRLFENRRSWGTEQPLVMLAVHNDNEKAAAKQFRAEATRDLCYTSLSEKGHNETVSSAIDLFRRQSVPTADPFTAKR